ncbi:uncharacterized protein LOC144118384 [Amblyomma americanum]
MKATVSASAAAIIRRFITRRQVQAHLRRDGRQHGRSAADAGHAPAERRGCRRRDGEQHGRRAADAGEPARLNNRAGLQVIVAELGVSNLEYCALLLTCSPTKHGKL